ncbi:hypothetical protein ACQ4PT_046643 [Festuca glaucescens]
MVAGTTGRRRTAATLVVATLAATPAATGTAAMPRSGPGCASTPTPARLTRCRAPHDAAHWGRPPGPRPTPSASAFTSLTPLHGQAFGTNAPPVPYSALDLATAPAWDTSVLMAALNNAATPSTVGEWVMDSGATAHMASDPGKWIFKHKFHSDGSLARYKARWVVRGFSQQHGVDLDETFSPIVTPAMIRIVLSIAVSRSWPVHQLDVKNAFLNGTLDEEAPRPWYQRFALFAHRLGFVASKSDVSLFIYKHGQELAYILLYVDDIVITASSGHLLQQLTQRLHSEFAMTDLGALSSSSASSSLGRRQAWSFLNGNTPLIFFSEQAWLSAIRVLLPSMFPASSQLMKARSLLILLSVSLHARPPIASSESCQTDSSLHQGHPRHEHASLLFSDDVTHRVLRR